MTVKSANNIKKRNWAFVTYPDSVPDNWVEELRKQGLMYAISPLHDADLKADETEKKPHWHVIVVYQNPTTKNNVFNLSRSFNGIEPISLESVRGYYRYFTHKDDPDKAQYDEREIVVGNGFNILDYVELTKTEVVAIRRKLQKYIGLHKFTEYYDFMEYVANEGTVEEYSIASSNTILFNGLIRSLHYVLKGMQKKVNHETGEVFYLNPETGRVLK